MKQENELTTSAATENSLVAPATQSETVISTNAEKLSEIIMKNIDMIQNDPSKIPQAEAINSQLKTLIDLGKAQIEGIKVAAFLSGR